MIRLLLLLLISCADVSMKLNTQVLYKKDIALEINKQRIVGVGSVPRAAKYDIYVRNPPANMDFLTLTTCGRDIQISNSNKVAYYEFVPNDVERECPLEIGAYDKKGRHGWGYVVFQNDVLPVKMHCNGEMDDVKGTSICQSKFGTIQKLVFVKPIKAAASDGCSFTQNGNEIEYKVQKGFCYYSFKDATGLFHEHTSFGYETYIIRTD